MDIYVEPVLPPARLLVFGVSLAARTLARIGRAMGYRRRRRRSGGRPAVFPDAERIWTEAAAPSGCRAARPCAVVATMGERDEAIAAARPRSRPPISAWSRARRASPTSARRSSRGGVAPQALAGSRAPRASTSARARPRRSRVAILAQIVSVRRRGAASASAPERCRGCRASRREAIDPVCGMTVAVAGRATRRELGGPHLVLLLRRLPREVSRRAGALHAGRGGRRS